MNRSLAATGLAIAVACAGVSSADAKGCIKGAVVGGVAGHIAHHHTLMGAAIGCAVGHHEAVKKEREDKAAAARNAQVQQHAH
jgi:hypothetical protein